MLRVYGVEKVFAAFWFLIYVFPLKYMPEAIISTSKMTPENVPDQPPKISPGPPKKPCGLIPIFRSIFWALPHGMAGIRRPPLQESGVLPRPRAPPRTPPPISFNFASKVFKLYHTSRALEARFPSSVLRRGVHSSTA